MNIGYFGPPATLHGYAGPLRPSRDGGSGDQPGLRRDQETARKNPEAAPKALTYDILVIEWV